MAGVLRTRSTQPVQRAPRLARRRRKRPALAADAQIYAQMLQAGPSRASLPALQRACGNQAACRLIQAQIEEEKPRRKSPAPWNIPKQPPPRQSELLRLINSGVTARSVPGLEQDDHLAEARKNGMAEVLAWEERVSGRLLRTSEHSSAFYKWLSRRIDKFPGHIALGENQYWAIDPKRGRIWLCTLHVVPAEEEGQEERRRERETARTAGVPEAARPGAAPPGALAGIAGTTAAAISAVSLLPRYIDWLSYGGKHKNPQLMVPATWYLKNIDQNKWNLITFLGISNFSRLMGQRAYQMALSSKMFGDLARTMGKATGQKMAALAGYELEIIETLRNNLQQSGMPPVQIRMTLETVQLAALLHKIPKLNEAIDTSNPQAVMAESYSLIESLTALLSLQFTGLSELMKSGEDDSGFYAACSKSALQRLYFMKRLLANPTALQHFLVEMNIKDQAVFEALHRILATITGTSSPILIRK